MHRIPQYLRMTGAALAGLLIATAPGLAAQGRGPRGSTAKCGDGSYSHWKVEAEACRDHDGLTVWYGLAPATTTATVAKHGDPVLTLEDEITRGTPNTVLHADADGTIQGRFVPDSADVALYSSFMVYLDKVQQESDCRKVSAHCAYCPIAHHYYCTNVQAFLPLMAF